MINPAWVGAVAALAMSLCGEARAGAPETFGRELCRSLAVAVDATGQSGPVLLPSYRAGPGGEPPLPIRSSAFVYDNALAAIALVSCGELGRARRIADAMALASRMDRTFSDGRIRNAYRAGPVGEDAPALPGWWDASARIWAEDAAQDGTATGNVAWAALALLTMYDATREPRYRESAGSLLSWAGDRSEGAQPGLTGGVHGFDREQQELRWKSTEHNLDVLAAAVRYRRADGQLDLSRLAETTRAFLDLAFDAGSGCFRLGTEPDGRLAGVSRLALDVQLWPHLAVAELPSDWARSLGCAERRMAVPGGFDFNDDGDGLWIEGTAQAALTYRALGRPDRAHELLAVLHEQRSPDGWLFATREERVTTGLSIRPDSVGNDFFYFRLPHLGATAWAVLALQGWNPFTGRRLD